MSDHRKVREALHVSRVAVAVRAGVSIETARAFEGGAVVSNLSREKLEPVYAALAAELSHGVTKEP